MATTALVFTVTTRCLTNKVVHFVEFVIYLMARAVLPTFYIIFQYRKSSSFTHVYRSSVITRVQMTVSEHYKPQGLIILAGTKVNTNQIMKYLNRIAFQLHM